LWVVLLLPQAWMKQLQWAYVVGALAAAVHMYVTTRGGTFRGYVYFMPIIELAQMSQLLGFFALLTIGYGTGDGFWQRIGIVLKLAAGVAGVYAAYLSQTRGAWLSIPVCVLIAAVVLGRHIPRRRILAMVAAALVLLAALFASSSLVQQRLDEVRHDLTQYYEKDNSVTSVGVRLQLWAGSWLLFLEHPAVGVGREGYAKAMLELEQRGILTPVSSHQPHSHNEILYNMVTLGVPGLLAILALYLVPAAYFLRAARHVDREIRVTGGMGLILCSGFLILGLTDVMFMWGACDNFYAIFAAILFAFIIRRKAMLPNP
ncbi:MAG: O-antigen ligase family protein, partial [Burkholderiaceae bacterium]